jgi:ABC-type transport system substrate-binding protein
LERPFAYSYDLAKAKSLLAEAGYPGGIDPKTGKQLRITVDVGNDSADTAESIELLASFYAQMGVKLEISVNTWQALQDKIRAGNVQLFMMGWVGDYPDLETFLQLFISSNTPTPNYSNFSHPEADACYQRAITSKNPDEIDACWKRMQEIILEECPWVLLHSAIDFTLVRDRVLNYRSHNYPYGMEKHYRVKNPRYQKTN